MSNIESMVIIKGQDSVYWLYDDATDKYTPTDISWRRFTEEEFMEIMKNDWGNNSYGWFDGDVVEAYGAI